MIHNHSIPQVGKIDYARSGQYKINLMSDPFIIYQIANLVAKSDSIAEGYSYGKGYGSFDSWKSELAKEYSCAPEYRQVAIDIFNCVRDWYLKEPKERVL